MSSFMWHLPPTGHCLLPRLADSSKLASKSSSSRRGSCGASSFPDLGRNGRPEIPQSNIKPSRKERRHRDGIQKYSEKRTVSPCASQQPSPPSQGSPLPSPAEIVTSIGRTLWGRGLPPGLLVDAVRETWTQGWKVMMSQLAPSAPDGSYQRPAYQFQDRIERGGKFPPERGRYHLYVGLPCPWAHRALVVHSMKGLHDSVVLNIVVPGPSGLWVFKPEGKEGERGYIDPTEDRAEGRATLKAVYGSRAGGYDGRATVPMLWDSVKKEVVNNESALIIEILNSAFDDFAAKPELDLYPERLRHEINAWNDKIYHNVNNGVYRCGFATSQRAYELALEDVFSTLDAIDRHLATTRFLCRDSEQPTLADVRLFTTLLRFDPVYFILFKCCRKRIADYPHLSGYLRDLFQYPGVAETCNLKAIQDNYFGSLFPLNPGGILPVMPSGADYDALYSPTDRHLIKATANV